jgi:hypothetical protein
MKKSFILSLVMVVVLIASLATATYAWYTAQTHVFATDVTVTTAGAADGLIISETYIDDTTYTNQSVRLTLGNSATIAPACLKSSIAPNAENTFGNFSGLTVNVTGSGVAATDAAPIDFLTLSDVTDTDAPRAGDNTFIYVANPGQSNAAYKVKVTISDGTTTTGLRIAVFQLENQTSAAANANAATLLGIWVPSGEKVGYANAIAQGNAFTAGKFAAESQEDVGSGVVKASETWVSCGTAAKTCDNNDVYAIKVWFEGDNITNALAGKTQLFKIDFELGNA